jgi:hypothetical protein
MLYWYLVLNIWYQSSRSWGFAATSETPWNFRYKLFFYNVSEGTTWRYLVDGSRYVGLKFKLMRPYTFRDTTYVI